MKDSNYWKNREKEAWRKDIPKVFLSIALVASYIVILATVVELTVAQAFLVLLINIVFTFPFWQTIARAIMPNNAQVTDEKIKYMKEN